ncbi:MAG: hypothetical protein OXE44_00480 [Nitrospinae bacterium]|nr:hypothetical protein [Nitrospinota bacterium]
MNPTQALVAIWLNVDAENHEEFRKWHNCEHSTDRMDGPGFRVGYRYNAVDAGANHNILCTFEGDTLSAFESDYYKESRDNPSPWTRECMAFIKNAERAVYSLQVSIGEPHRYDAPYVYMVSPNPETEEMKEEMIAWYREEHLERLYEVEGMTRGRVYQLETAATGGATAEAEIQETTRSARRIIAIYDMEDPTIPTTDAWEEAAYGTSRSAAMRPNLKNAVRETWWLDFVKWKRG